YGSNRSRIAHLLQSKRGKRMRRLRSNERSEASIAAVSTKKPEEFRKKSASGKNIYMGAIGAA
ncbi:MAG: hypothetical protein IKB93_11780, partial [Clostridia bacterium]|nr:hypothetical protein [Clostridia bacterium]